MSDRSMSGSVMAEQLGTLRMRDNGLGTRRMFRWSIAAALLSIAAPAAASPERPLVLAFGDSLTAGYDNFNDQRLANNHQSGSDYRIYNTGTIVRGTGENAVVYPVTLGDGSAFIQWNPIPLGSEESGTSYMAW